MPMEQSPWPTESPCDRERTTVFFDGGCPMCRREIAHYQRLDGAGRIRWLDIHREPDVVAEVGVSWETAMQRLHVRSGTGELHTGVPAFVAIWREASPLPLAGPRGGGGARTDPAARLRLRPIRTLALAAPLPGWRLCLLNAFDRHGHVQAADDTETPRAKG
jgi:hypothetical protein